MSASLGYRWWTVFGWRTPDAIGVKLGPLTVTTYRSDWDFFDDGTAELFIGIGNRWIVYDSWIRRTRRLNPPR